MRDDQDRAVGGGLAQRPGERGLVDGVEVRGRLVQQEQPRPGEQGAGQGDALPLPRGEGAAAVAEPAVEAAGQPPHHGAEPGQPDDAEDLVLPGAGRGVGEVLPERALQHMRVLVHQGDTGPALPAAEGGGGAAVETDGPGIRLVQARDQGEEGALARPRAADQGHQSMARHGERHPAQHRPVRDVPEADVGQLQRGRRRVRRVRRDPRAGRGRSGSRGRDGGGRRRDGGGRCGRDDGRRRRGGGRGPPVRFLGQGEGLVDPPVRARAPLDQPERAEDRGQRQDEVRRVQQEGDQIAEGPGTAAVDPQAPDDQDEQEGALDRQFDGAAHDRRQLRRPDARAVRRVHPLADTARLALLGPVHAHHRQGAERALQLRGDGADGVLHALRRRPDALQEQRDGDGGQGDRRHDEQQQQGVQPQHQQQRPGRDQAPGHQIDQRLRDDVPQQGGVGGDPGDQITAAPAVQLPHLQPQQPRHEGVPHHAHHALAHAVQQEAADRARRRLGGEERAQDEQQRPRRLTAGAGVHDVLGDERLGEPQRRRGQRQRGRHGDAGPVARGQPEEGGHRSGQRPAGRRRGRPFGRTGVRGRPAGAVRHDGVAHVPARGTGATVTSRAK